MPKKLIAATKGLVVSTPPLAAIVTARAEIIPQVNAETRSRMFESISSPDVFLLLV
ncbi:hypothetical protein FHR99_003211 [Litorivivens lipolytica]|uniref:Uncharacterized protein n=1 Tax=Litorivivens lipolytica TaxID=1524264 RepID=A0A7W4W7M5_9GAMM|nr:hypothetical protein [Litorivivens lipolytica]